VNEKKLLMTLTGEIFHPARIHYHVFDKNKLLRIFGKLNCMAFDPSNNRWVWLYESEAKKLKFSTPYSSIPKAQRPIVLGSCYLRTAGEALIDLRSFERVVKAILFFDNNIPRTVAKATAITIVNKCFEFSTKVQLNFDEFFESNQVVSKNPEAVLDRLEGMKAITNLRDRLTKVMTMIESEAKTALPEIERLPVNYYEDGISSLETALRVRDIIALEHWKGNNDFTFLDVLKGIT